MDHGPANNTDPRTCTCHPDDSPPVPCARKYALSECRADAQERLIETLTAALEGLLLCPAIADENHCDPEWGDLETAEAEIIARTALSQARKQNP